MGLKVNKCRIRLRYRKRVRTRLVGKNNADSSTPWRTQERFALPIRQRKRSNGDTNCPYDPGSGLRSKAIASRDVASSTETELNQRHETHVPNPHAVGGREWRGSEI